MKHSIKTMTVIALIIGFLFTAAACGPNASSTDDKTIRVGATPAPHAEILEQAKDALKAKGYTLEIVEFTEYTTINPALEGGDLDANYFQHTQYLADYNEKNGQQLVSAGKVHYEPYGLYGGKKTSLDDLEAGATVAVPNDATNEARALLLLEQAGLITLKEGAGILATIQDVVDNPHGLDIVELAAEQIPRALQDVDYAVINGNYAIAAGLNVAEDALVIEAADGEAGDVYANVIAVTKDRADDAAIAALLEVLQSEAMRTWITNEYGGAVLPVR